MSLKEFIYFNKKKIILFIFSLIIGSIFLIYYFYDQDKKDSDFEIKNDVEEEKLEKNEEEVSNKEEPLLCFYDIKGEVNKPGVYSIDCSKRIIDAINISGGLTKNSDTSIINLSKKIEDGMVIIVYSKKEISDYLNTLKQKEEKESICDNSNIVNDACIKKEETNNSLININKASLEELMTLTGIGESKAKSIIAYRSKTPFKVKEDILNVEGIGESLYASIKENITV